MNSETLDKSKATFSAIVGVIVLIASLWGFLSPDEATEINDAAAALADSAGAGLLQSYEGLILVLTSLIGGRDLLSGITGLLKK